MEKYIVFIAGINPNSMGKMREVITECINKGYKRLYFLIASGGGDAIEGLNMAALIRSLSIETIMHNIGQVDSVANVLFASADKKYAQINASFMFHEVEMELKKSFTEQQLFEKYQIIKRCREDIVKNFSLYTGLPIENVRSLMTYDETRGIKILTAEEAKRMGIIDDIKDAKIPEGADAISIGNM